MPVFEGVRAIYSKARLAASSSVRDLVNESQRKKRRPSQWYSVSVDSVRLWLGLGLLVATGLGSYTGYQRWSSFRVEQKAFENVAKSERLARQLREEPDHRSYISELTLAETSLDDARRQLQQAEYRESAASGQLSFDRLQDIYSLIRRSGSIAWFRSVEGDVRYRRGEAGEFLRAYARVELHDGDYVRSGAGASAEIHFQHDDTVFTLRPRSLLKLSRPSEGADRSLGFMEYGWVRLDTADSESALRTPYTEVQVAENSAVSLELPLNSKETKVQSLRGRAQVTALESGETRQLGERQQVSQAAGNLGRTVALPAAPLLSSPPDNFSIDIDTVDRVVLEWTPVEGVSRYALQVSKRRLFGENVIDASDRSAAKATLGLREQGRYIWRVASYSRAGVLGPWSDVRKFRVSSYRSLALERDVDPPTIEVEVIMNGNIAVLQGKSEPGAMLQMNGREIPLAADGTFSTSKIIMETGRVALDFLATDGAGNQARERRWVYLDEG